MQYQVLLSVFHNLKTVSRHSWHGCCEDAASAHGVQWASVTLLVPRVLVLTAVGRNDTLAGATTTTYDFNMYLHEQHCR